MGVLPEKVFYAGQINRVATVLTKTAEMQKDILGRLLVLGATTKASSRH